MQLRCNHSSKALFVKDPRVLQLIRVIYLLRISNWYSEKTNQFVLSLIDNYQPDIVFVSEFERKTIRWLLNYLDYDKIKEERRVFLDTFEKAPVWRIGAPNDKTLLIKYLYQLRCLKHNFLDQIITHIID